MAVTRHADQYFPMRHHIQAVQAEEVA